ncbi:endonuclease domain-containing protein, partial [uncultured Sphingomonas sp.]|uniref:endonuclease domain-containing protein n=1 Tax=uncultured Sphingomonas sp. TaxID=158754 RepID=UPI0035CC5C73
MSFVIVVNVKIDPVLLDRARKMRREPTEAEARLWRHLRNRQLGGVKFVRQHVGGAIPDFVARSAKLIIEVDGDTHSDQARDERRSALLQKQGFNVIRFSNLDVMTNPDGVCHAIIVALGAAPPPPPPPPPGGGGGGGGVVS